MPFPLPGDLSDPRIKPWLLCLLHWQACSLPLSHLLLLLTLEKMGLFDLRKIEIALTPGLWAGEPLLSQQSLHLPEPFPLTPQQK